MLRNIELPGRIGTPMPSIRRHERFESLDMMRGLAATAVVIYHMGEVRLEPSYVSHGYLAVDFFFLMSGFVVAVAYSKALRSTLSLSEFSLKRSVRLYPISMAGALLGLLVLLMKHFYSPQRVGTLASILLSGAFNLLLLPDFFTRATSYSWLFPGNGPLWSLFFEFFINIFWAWLVSRLRGKLLTSIVAMSWALLIITASKASTLNIGFDRMTFAGGLARVFFGFLAGVGIYELWVRGYIPQWRSHPGFAVLILTGVFLVPSFAQSTGDVFFCIVAISLVFPVLMILCLAHGKVGKFGRLAGALSYPIYAVHFPILQMAAGLHQSKPHVNVHIISLFAFMLIATSGYFVSEHYDKPLRKLLIGSILKLPRRSVQETLR